MKLRINAKLRAALIAAITVVGFTLTQAQAEESNLALFNLSADTLAGHAGATSVSVTQGSVTLTLSTTWAQGLGSGTTTYTTFNVAGVSTDLLNTNAMVTDGSIADTYSTFVSAGAKNDGADLTITLSGLNAGGKYDVSLVSGITFEGAGSWSDINTTNAFTSSVDMLGNDKIQAKSLSGFAVVDMVADSDGCITFTINDKGAHTAVINGIAIAGAPYVPPTDLTWAGTEQDHVLTSSVWDNGQTTTAEYSATDPLIFGADGWKEVTVATATTANSLTVQEGEYTLDASAAALTATKITVDTGATLTIKGTVEVGGSVSAADAGSLIVSEGATLKANAAAAAKSLLTADGVANSGTVEIGADVTVDSSLTSKLGGTVAVASGKKLTLGTTKDNHTIDLTSLDALVLGQGANIDTKALKVDINNLTANGSTLKMLDTKDKNQVGVDLKGTTKLEGNLTITSDWKYKINIEKLAGSGSLELTGGNEEHRAVIGDVAINSLTVTNKMNNVDLTGTVALSGVLGVNGTTNVTGQNAMTVGGLTGSAALNVANGITFNVAEGGNYSYTGTLTVGGQIVKQGTGAQTISGTALHHTLDVQAGTLVLNGNFAIDDVAEGDTTISYLDSTGAVSTNGFQKASGTLTVYNDHSSAGTLDLTSGRFTYGANDVTETVRQGNGVYTLSGEVDYATLYVNENTEALAVYQKAASDQGLALADVVMKDATTLTVDADYSGTISVTSGKGKVNISEGKTLTGTKSNITLAGAGTYALNSGDTSLGGVTLDEGWTGVVRITDASLNNINLSGMRNAQSTVELKGFNGWTDPWEGTNGYNFKLTNGSNGYAWQNGAFGQNSATHIMEFTGVWSGDGLFLETGNTATRNMHYTYSGNIAAWTGEFRHDAKQDTNLTFKGSATNVNIAISKGASSTGVFNVVAGTTGVTFNKSVTADKLTVQEGATATFNGVATFGSVTEAASAGITVGTTGNLTLNGGSLTAAITNNGTLTFGGDITATGLTVTKGTSGLVDVNGATNTGNGFETTSGDSITIANNAATATLTPNGHKVTQDSVEYTIQADGTAVTAGGGTKYSTYYQTNGEVSTSDIAAAASSHQGLFTSAYVSGTGTLKVDSGVGIVAAAGGEVVFSGEGATDMLYVSDDAKVTGLTDFSVMTIDATKTATMDEDIVAGNVFFSTVDGGVQVTNTSTDTPITYSINEESAQVTANTMTVDGDTGVEIANSLVVKEIVNNNADGLVLNGNVADGVTLRAVDSNIVMTGQTSNTVSVVDLDIAPGNAVTLMDGQQEEGTITVSGVLKGAEAAVYADLTLLGGSTLNVSGGNDKALTLGSELTIDLSNKSLVNLDDDTLIALNNMGAGETLKLIVSVDSVLDALTYGGDGYDGLGYDELFSRIGGQGVELQGNYTVYAKDDAFGLTKQGAVPEPTTGTLSLLALMALAARRRRK